MANYDNYSISELAYKLTREIEGEVRIDKVTRLLYSTDASIYQIEPLGVVFPRSQDDLQAAVTISAQEGVPVLARGAGSSLAGQAIGPALILDCSRYLDRIEVIDPNTHSATVEPGVILNALNRSAGKSGLIFGPDPASGERATMGGSLASNATGAHSILYGMAADHLRSVDVVLSDGSAARFESLPLDQAQQIAENEHSIEAAIYRAALRIRSDYWQAIHERWPRTWRRASGYNLNYLLPWAASKPVRWSSFAGRTAGGQAIPYPPVLDGQINLAPLIAGSEGTLAVIQRATINLMPTLPHKLLGVLAFKGIAEACDAVPGLLEQSPSAVELIPRTLIHLARSVPAYAQQLSFVQGDPAALLVIEFAGENPERLRQQVRSLGSEVLIAESALQQRQVWAVRKVGLGLLMSRAGDLKPWSFIEDLSVPVDVLGEFVRAMQSIMATYHVEGNFYAHASAGCLHIRPLVNLKQVKGVATMRAIAAQAVDLTIQLGGSVSGEHGDGLARSEWLERMFGSEIIQAFRELKTAADPQWLLNPGKIVARSGDSLPKMDSNLRFGNGYQSITWEPVLSFANQAELDGAVEQCNGAGVCRKFEGVMCPSFQATREEMHSTRGRANLMRAMISGQFPSGKMSEKTVYEALDLCLACKGCKAECPSAVDMAKLKYEFLQHYYTEPMNGHRHRMRDYLFAYLDRFVSFGYPFAPVVNTLLRSRLGSSLGESLLGLAPERPFPQLKTKPLGRLLINHRHSLAQPESQKDSVLLLADAFNYYFYPQVALAGVLALEMAGCQVILIPVTGAGRTLISKGFLKAARRHAEQLVTAIKRLDPDGKMPVVGLEPSEIYTLRDEYLDLFPDDPYITRLAEHAWMIDEFLIRPGVEGIPRIRRILEKKNHAPVQEKVVQNVLLHGHCYQKAQPPAADGFPTGVSATVAMLEAAGYQVQVIDSGCCGMAGAFGYEAEHYALSMQIGELSLLPAVRAAPDEIIIAASGISCQSQIEDGTTRAVKHPVTLI